MYDDYEEYGVPRHPYYTEPRAYEVNEGIELMAYGGDHWSPEGTPRIPGHVIPTTREHPTLENPGCITSPTPENSQIQQILAISDDRGNDPSEFPYHPADIYWEDDFTHVQRDYRAEMLYQVPDHNREMLSDAEEMEEGGKQDDSWKLELDIDFFGNVSGETLYKDHPKLNKYLSGIWKNGKIDLVCDYNDGSQSKFVGNYDDTKVEIRVSVLKVGTEQHITNWAVGNEGSGEGRWYIEWK